MILAGDSMEGSTCCESPSLQDRENNAAHGCCENDKARDGDWQIEEVHRKLLALH